MDKKLECLSHDWEAGTWGVIIDVSRCKKCGRVSTREDFPAHRDVCPTCGNTGIDEQGYQCDTCPNEEL